MRADNTPLDLIGIRLGTDKSRLRQDYLRQYERMMTGFRDRPITLLEIGIDQGASLRTWEIYFPKASIIGVDIVPNTRRFARKNVTIEIGSQFDGEFLASLAQKYTPDIIIDDGSHISEHQIFSFERLFHGLKRGGLYVVEDIQHGPGKELAADYFTALQHKVLLRQVGVGEAGVSTHFKATDVSHVDTIPGAVVVSPSGAVVTTRPMMLRRVIGPNWRESFDAQRLSPITKYSPAGMKVRLSALPATGLCTCRGQSAVAFT